MAAPWFTTASSGQPREQPVQPKGIAHTDDAVWGVVIESKRDVEVDLVGLVQPIDGTGVQQNARRCTFGIVCDILGEQLKMLGELFLHDKRRLGDAPGRKVGRTKKLGDHSADAPAVA